MTAIGMTGSDSGTRPTQSFLEGRHMPGTTSPCSAPTRVFRAAAVALRGWLMASLLLTTGGAPRGQDRGRALGLRNGDARATLGHDIAPWDQPAFSPWIPAETFGGKPDSWISLTVWNGPDASRETVVCPGRNVILSGWGGDAGHPRHHRTSTITPPMASNATRKIAPNTRPSRQKSRRSRYPQA